MTSTRRALAAALMVLSAAPACAWFNAGIKETAGSNTYFGTDVFGTVGLGDFSIRPDYSMYHSSLSSGSYKTGSVRGGFDTTLFGVGATVGATPKIGGYGNNFVGVDGTLTLTPSNGGANSRINGRDQSPGTAKGKGLARVDIGGAYTHTEHTDNIMASGAQRATPIHIGQSDFTGSVGVSILDNLISVDVTKSAYDRTLDSTMRAPQVVRLPGLNFETQGFPKQSVNVRLEMSEFPLITPFAGYTHTTWQLSQPNSDAYTVGGYVEFNILEIQASYQRYAIGAGFAAQNYVTVGATARF